ncbi:serine/threonine-protein phosphatase BSL1-like [Helianthus annuus]|uniref:serine/threonine-protein phosphatase BSL1-like n=1 Tax=Helianthus annuus TaxID=4232 RepID=UPI001652DA77|nr:serine/threonine-protein phosphatase BSL1-like [Helianthus annuus]
MFDLETFRWTKVITLGVGPSARFSMAGSTLHPQHGGILIFMGGCNKSLEALDDMFYLHADCFSWTCLSFQGTDGYILYGHAHDLHNG